MGCIIKVFTFLIAVLLSIGIISLGFFLSPLIGVLFIIVLVGSLVFHYFESKNKGDS